METDEKVPGLAGSKACYRLPASGLLGKVLAFVTGIALMILAFTFSLLVLAIVVTGGLLVWVYLWWATRAQRKRMQMYGKPMGGRVIEGEAIREVEPSDHDQR